jgi:hypothetical protein
MRLIVCASRTVQQFSTNKEQLMFFSKRILSMSIAVAFAAVPAFAAQSARGAASTPTKTSSPKSTSPLPKNHVAKGSVVAQTDQTLTVRSGKKDMTFKISPTTPKPSTMTPGSNVTVNYHDEGTQHIASNIEMAPTQSNAAAAKTPARK